MLLSGARLPIFFLELFSFLPLSSEKPVQQVKSCILSLFPLPIPPLAFSSFLFKENGRPELPVVGLPFERRVMALKHVTQLIDHETEGEVENCPQNKSR